MLAVALHALVDLDRELAGRREDEAAHRVQRGREALCRERREPLQQGERESCRLAGAGLRGAEKVASREDDGDGLRLDGGGFGIALLRDGTKQLGQQPEAFERRTDNVLLMIGPRRTSLRNRFRQTKLR